ncbi:4-oxalocrotonate tautomerase [Ferrithrix thermotolerans DSM 19514]|uniref:Tautomerase n=2 Tax=Ferrithrix TaxID=643949 RepID=A0A1M4V260_9ACTN|nr:4-oxalocrotonate tautomerase [Ferrithrix thermotolerans DSM 19514]
MPLIHVEMLEGRSEEIKEQLIAELTDTTVSVLGVNRESVRVVLVDVPKSHWGIGGVTAKELGR